MGRSRRWLIDEKPVPKSSTHHDSPSSFTVSISRTVASTTRNRAVSVTSRWSRDGSTPAPRTSSAIHCEKPGVARVAAEMLIPNSRWDGIVAHVAQDGAEHGAVDVR